MSLDNAPIGKKENKRVRGAKALELRIAGGSYRQIARQLGVGERTAYKDVQGELAKLDTVKAQLAERLRDVELERLDKATIALGPGVSGGDPQAINALVRVMDRRAKLLGLDAPVRTDTRFEGGALPVSFTLVLDRPPLATAGVPVRPLLNVGPHGNGNGSHA